MPRSRRDLFGLAVVRVTCHRLLIERAEFDQVFDGAVDIALGLAFTLPGRQGQFFGQFGGLSNHGIVAAPRISGIDPY